MMRVVDVIYAVPQLLLVLIFLNLFGPGLTNIFIAIGLVGWVTEARLVRGQFLALREQEYVNAARVAGAGGWSIMFRHLLPNSLTPIIVALSFGIPTAIFTEAALSYVGVGIQPPDASWGNMVGTSSQTGYVQSDPHMLLVPGSGDWPDDARLHLPGRWFARRTGRARQRMTVHPGRLAAQARRRSPSRPTEWRSDSGRPLV